MTIRKSIIYIFILSILSSCVSNRCRHLESWNEPSMIHSNINVAASLKSNTIAAGRDSSTNSTETIQQASRQSILKSKQEIINKPNPYIKTLKRSQPEFQLRPSIIISHLSDSLSSQENDQLLKRKAKASMFFGLLALFIPLIFLLFFIFPFIGNYILNILLYQFFASLFAAYFGYTVIKNKRSNILSIKEKNMAKFGRIVGSFFLTIYGVILLLITILILSGVSLGE